MNDENSQFWLAQTYSFLFTRRYFFARRLRFQLMSEAGINLSLY
ncbi:hypothetical protein HMPREF9701_04001 [Delftia acidovorans CCUG 274B]|uniref:Uncharacterized protein n=1 Tax=Delftia lacustris TaxID=558537 RepID=A0A1H3U7X7_9BURK|nr:hypothetical protein HMPREF9701_04001 [Delftia acidovorans CCUG 274B]SDZ57915.1 hypothetical protein SAMN05421547_13820 [Delftia lacustris]